MASETITLQAMVCDNHMTFVGSGAKAGTLRLLLSDLTDPITADEFAAWVKVTVKLCKADKTLAQTKTALLAGITVTV